jgi:hypothetical protein
MAKKKSNKRFSQKVHKIVKSDLFTSIAIASVILNILFLTGVFVLTSDNTFDRDLYTNVRGRYCRNIDGVVERAKELGSEEKALKEWQVVCVSKEFSPYYQEAIEKFEAQSNK